MLFAEGYNDA